MTGKNICHLIHKSTCITQWLTKYGSLNTQISEKEIHWIKFIAGCWCSNERFVSNWWAHLIMNVRLASNARPLHCSLILKSCLWFLWPSPLFLPNHTQNHTYTHAEICTYTPRPLFIYGTTLDLHRWPPLVWAYLSIKSCASQDKRSRRVPLYYPTLSTMASEFHQVFCQILLHVCLWDLPYYHLCVSQNHQKKSLVNQNNSHTWVAN